ncbi:trimethyllysine dioxygenase [Colletotrichum paranaense]|uniref:Trimethyllysine dioxygenase n=1 Tax=Colletotrichum paranaense TaxID=1914294 RepID=A0ABQ9SJU6_9PEZI|nr:trimethyllysine dioxygenase [Colletotrichum paranaense]KAK1538157.1 trimethyllysine dioxygenase [Colletotrichum paranaense]
MLPWRTIAPRAARRSASAFGAPPRRIICGGTFGSASRHLSATAAARQLNAKVVTEGVQFEGLTGVSTRRSTLPHFWLSKCVNQDTTQRNFDTYAISQDIRPSEIKSQEKGIKVTCSHAQLGEQDGHESFYPWHFIKHYLQHDHRSPEQVNYHFWGSDVGERRPVVEYDHLMTDKDDSGVAKLTNLIREYGFAFVDGTPYDTPEPTQRVLERIAFIRETHYGGFYDFVPDLAMADTAYTNIALPAHTDTTYFTDPAGLQAFHMLSHEAPPGQQLPEDGKLGGESLLVDAFYAAQILQKEDPAAYEILSKVRLPWHASGNEGITISPDKRYPVLEVDPQTRTLQRVRWNNDDRGVVPFTDDVSPTAWYAAARKWDAILRRSDVEFWWQLRPGQVLIFDNWRVMHGRSAFEGRRRIAGAYINRDDFVSRWRNTNFPHEQVLNQVVG